MCKIFVGGYIIKGLRALEVIHWNTVLFHLDLNTIMKNRSEQTNVDLLSNSLLLNIILKEQSCHTHTNTEVIFFCLFPLAVRLFSTISGVTMILTL